MDLEQLSEQVALFDMDGSLFDYDAQMKKSLDALASPEEEPLDYNNMWSLEGRLPYLKARMDLIKSIPGWWRSLPVIPQGMQIYELALQVGFENHILTKGPKLATNAWTEKLQACQEHFGSNIDVHVTSDKRLTYGKLLYDDYPNYMLRWLRFRPRGLGIMPVTEYNKDFTHPNVIKWDGTNYAQVEAALKLCFNRKTGEALDLKGVL